MSGITHNLYWFSCFLFKFNDNEFYESKQVLEAYVTDKSFREIIDNKKFADLNTHPSGEFFKKLSPEVREKLPSYIKENIDINRFINALGVEKVEGR